MNYGIIPLGRACKIAMFLEEKGFRGFSFPFDWVITEDFDKVIELIGTNFDGFLKYENLVQQRKCPIHYFDNQNKIYFFHDFNRKSINKQLNGVLKKYERRIRRFYQSITKPTIFIRQVKDIEEYRTINLNIKKYVEVLRKYCSMNELILVNNDNVIIATGIQLEEYLYNYIDKEQIKKNLAFYKKHRLRIRVHRLISKLKGKMCRFLPHYICSSQY